MELSLVISLLIASFNFSGIYSSKMKNYLVKMFYMSLNKNKFFTRNPKPYFVIQYIRIVLFHSFTDSWRTFILSQWYLLKICSLMCRFLWKHALFIKKTTSFYKKNSILHIYKKTQNLNLSFYKKLQFWK